MVEGNSQSQHNVIKVTTQRTNGSGPGGSRVGTGFMKTIPGGSSRFILNSHTPHPSHMHPVCPAPMHPVCPVLMHPVCPAPIYPVCPALMHIVCPHAPCVSCTHAHSVSCTHAPYVSCTHAPCVSCTHAHSVSSCTCVSCTVHPVRWLIYIPLVW